jgi:hypothetical protein
MGQAHISDLNSKNEPSNDRRHQCREPSDAATVRDDGTADRVAALASGLESTTAWGKGRGDGALAFGLQNCGCKRAGGVYTAVAQDAKMVETLAYISEIRLPEGGGEVAW